MRFDPQQAPARAELLLGADFGQEARGRPIHGRPESEDGGADDEPGPWLKFGAVLTRRLAVSEAAARPSGSVYGRPLRGTRDNAPTVPIGAPVILAGLNGGRDDDAALDECGAVQALPRESAGDLARIDGVTPGTATIITVAVCTGTPPTTPPSRPS